MLMNIFQLPFVMFFIIIFICSFLLCESQTENSLPSHAQSTSNTETFTDNLRSSAYKKSPEIHDLVRFQNAIMTKYYQTQDLHFKNIADALKPQIDEKIRAFNGDRSSPGKYAN